ncbi:MAG TPA: cell cycle transcriptional regulator TrcR [Skermanella sp.]|jgi:uncharacterized protein|nr:cell cycle transcriptional regulator TrcR [Skermanella sp.]
MPLPLMPKATAVWLVENTALTFEQIAAFCGLHSLEIKAIADGEVAVGMVGLDPIANGQLSKEEIERAEKDEHVRLRLLVQDLPQPVARSKGPRYTPVTKRGDKPDAIAWVVKQFPDLSDAQISKLIGTTKPTIAAIRDRTHWNTPNIKPRSPVLLGLCTQRELEEALATIRRPPGAPPITAADAHEHDDEEDAEARPVFGDDNDHGKYGRGHDTELDETVD